MICAEATAEQHRGTGTSPEEPPEGFALAGPAVAGAIDLGDNFSTCSPAGQPRSERASLSGPYKVHKEHKRLQPPWSDAYIPWRGTSVFW